VNWIAVVGTRKADGGGYVITMAHEAMAQWEAEASSAAHSRSSTLRRLRRVRGLTMPNTPDPGTSVRTYAQPAAGAEPSSTLAPLHRLSATRHTNSRGAARQAGLAPVDAPVLESTSLIQPGLFDEFTAALGQVFEQISRTLTSSSRQRRVPSPSTRPLVEPLERAGPHRQTRPHRPMAARYTTPQPQHRPTTGHRPPRRIDPTRTRR